MTSLMKPSLDQILDRLNLKLPPPAKPVGVYRPFTMSEGVVYLSGQISRDAEGRILTGQVGRELTVEEGKRAARLAALQAVSLIQAEWGLGRIGQIFRVAGFVQSADHFYGQSDVMNAASELFGQIFGEAGRHARTSVGVPSLPLNAAVEIELTVKLK